MSKRAVLGFSTLVPAFLVGLTNVRASDWDSYGDVSVVWAENEGIRAFRFDSSLEDDLADSGCSRRNNEIVTVLSQQFYTANRSDDLFRARNEKGSVNSYRIPFNEAPRVIESWLFWLVEEGRTIKVSSVSCGMGGFIYVNQISQVD